MDLRLPRCTVPAGARFRRGARKSPCQRLVRGRIWVQMRCGPYDPRRARLRARRLPVKGLGPFALRDSLEVLFSRGGDASGRSGRCGSHWNAGSHWFPLPLGTKFDPVSRRNPPFFLLVPSVPTKNVIESFPISPFQYRSERTRTGTVISDPLQNRWEPWEPWEPEMKLTTYGWEPRKIELGTSGNQSQFLAVFCRLWFSPVTQFRPRLGAFFGLRRALLGPVFSPKSGPEG